MDDTPTPKRPRNRALVVVLIVLALLFTCFISALFAGLAGYAIGRSSDRGAMPVPAPERVERVPRQDILPMPELPQGAPSVSGWSLVVEVIADSPADRAGLRVGDIITTVDGDAIEEGRTLADVIGAYEPGDEVELGMMRDGEFRTITVTLDSNPDDEAVPWLGIYYRQMPGGPAMRFESPSLRNRDVPWSSQ